MLGPRRSDILANDMPLVPSNEGHAQPTGLCGRSSCGGWRATVGGPGFFSYRSPRPRVPVTLRRQCGDLARQYLQASEPADRDGTSPAFVVRARKPDRAPPGAGAGSLIGKRGLNRQHRGRNRSWRTLPAAMFAVCSDRFDALTVPSVFRAQRDYSSERSRGLSWKS